VHLSPETSLAFESNLKIRFREMIDFGYGHAIGKQDRTLYFRANDHFAWHIKGNHDDGYINPGGGNRVMWLNAGRLQIEVTNVYVFGAFSAESINNISDRHLKKNLEPVDAQEVLAKVAALPIQRWNLKSDERNTPHLGPMAQDVHAAFGVGADDRHISTIDADGVALAAIQGLNLKLERELRRRDVENAELRERVTRIEKLLEDLTKHRGAQ
jgi:hypothetical protein